MSEHASFLYFVHLSFLHQSALPKAQQSDLPVPVLVAWSSHNLMIPLHASPPTVLVWFEQVQFTCFTYIHTFFSLNMSEHVWFCFTFHVARLIASLNRAIHQHIFSHLAGTQYIDYITCLANKHFFLANFASLLIF